MGSLGAVPFGVGHGAVHGQVVILYVDQKFLEVFMVMGAVFFIDFIGGGINGIEGVHAYAALEAAGGLLTQQALHLYLLDQVIGGLVQVGEAVYRMAGQVGGSGHQVLVFGILGQGIGHGYRVDGRTDNGMVHPVINLFPEHIYFRVELAQAFYVFSSSHQSHFGFSFIGKRNPIRRPKEADRLERGLYHYLPARAA